MPQLDCPRCTRPLNRTSLGCICPDCEGVWFGFDQFDTALRLSDLQLETSDIERTLQFDKPGVSLEHHIKCPDCALRMKRHVYMMDSGVVVDMCRDHGMWLDDGELSKIRKYLQTAPGNKSGTAENEKEKSTPAGFFRRLFGGKT